MGPWNLLIRVSDSRNQKASYRPNMCVIYVSTLSLITDVKLSYHKLFSHIKSHVGKVKSFLWRLATRGAVAVICKLQKPLKYSSWHALMETRNARLEHKINLWTPWFSEAHALCKHPTWPAVQCFFMRHSTDSVLSSSISCTSGRIGRISSSPRWFH